VLSIKKPPKGSELMYLINAFCGVFVLDLKKKKKNVIMSHKGEQFCRRVLLIFILGRENKR
jgi:hypothetical protein